MTHICELLRGFTHPDTYFAATEDGFYFLEAGVALPENSIHEFSRDVEALLVVTLESGLVLKLVAVLHDCLFADARVLDDDDHRAVAAVHEFLHNIHAYSMLHADAYRAHLLCDTPLVPQLVLPYLERCVYRRGAQRRADTDRATLAQLANDSTVPTSARRSAGSTRRRRGLGRGARQPARARQGHRRTLRTSCRGFRARARARAQRAAAQRDARAHARARSSRATTTSSRSCACST